MSTQQAKFLRIKVERDGEVKVDLKMPARCIMWIKELLPEDALKKIEKDNISLADIQQRFKTPEDLVPQEIFTLTTLEKKITIWLE